MCGRKMVEPHNAYAPPTVTASTGDTLDTTVSDRRYRWALFLAFVCVVGSPIASAVAVFDIETILGSGSILAGLSLGLAFLPRAPMLRPLLLISAAGVAIVVGCYFVIYLNGWGPAIAQEPIGHATVVLSLVMQAGWIPIRRVAQTQARSKSLRNQEHSAVAVDTTVTSPNQKPTPRQ